MFFKHTFGTKKKRFLKGTVDCKTMHFIQNYILVHVSHLEQ